MKHHILATAFGLATALTVMTDSAATANTITQPDCNFGSTCRSAVEENAATAGIMISNGSAGIGSTWGTGGTLQVGRPIAEPDMGCGNCNHDTFQVVVVENNCSLSPVDRFVGHHISLVDNHSGLRMRVFTPDRMIGTMDYWPDRFNFFTDADGMITRVTCG